MKSIDLFAGAGGLSSGLEMSGFHPILANELVPQFAETYKLNNPNTEVVVGDIRQVCETNLKKKLGLKEGQLDLLAGGPPCQGFSVNAPIRSLDDERNHLFKDFLRVTATLLPKVVLIENVPGIVQLGMGTVVEQIYKELQSLGYTVEHKILFAGHFGVPQMRFRTVFLAIKDYDKKIEFPEPEYDTKAIANFSGAKQLCQQVSPLFQQLLKRGITVSDTLSDLPSIESGCKISQLSYKTEPLSEYQKYLRTGSDILMNHVCSGLGKVNQERLKYIPQGGSWRDIPFELLPDGLKRARRSDHTKRYGRLHPDGICSTVLTKCDPHWGSFFHPTEDRVISVREAARFQSFLDKHHFTGNLSQQYEQVGNAVPPLLGRAIGNQIRKITGN